MLGKYYYFTDYENIIKQCSIRPFYHKNSENTNKSILIDNGNNFFTYETDENYIQNEIIIRYAIFLEKMQVKLNKETDWVDDCKLTEHLLMTLNAKSKKYNNIKLQMRLSDRDSLWVLNNDSVYIGKVLLDDGNIFQEGPLWVLKKYENQIPLS